MSLPPSAFTALAPSALQDILADPSALILDIRPLNSYSQARIPNALSLSVPSTLLKRPLFSLSRLTQMLPSQAGRARFANWPAASRILVYDADSASLPAQGGNILGLMRKFRSEGYPEDRDVAWLSGGFFSIWRDHPQWVDREPIPEEMEEDEGDLMQLTGETSPSRVLRAKLPSAAFTSASTIPMRPSKSAPKMLPPSTLPVHAVQPTFGQSSLAPIPATPAGDVPPPIATSQSQGEFVLRLPSSAVRTRTLPGLSLKDMAPPTAAPLGPLFSLPTISPQYVHSGAYGPGVSRSLPGKHVASNPFFDSIRQNLELSNRSRADGESAAIPLKLPRRVRQRVGELPFEWLRQIARRSKRGTESSAESSDTTGAESEGSSGSSSSRPIPIPKRRKRPPRSSSPWSSTSPPDADELTRDLEQQFYKIELNEQRRLLGVMERHSLESGRVITEPPRPVERADSKAPSTVIEEAIASFPFSITAGLEKGAKNRYRYIWPFEHARVRLQKLKPDDDDYMNASYVQPLGTHKRYIATQGPLPATFNDFWTLCWEQNVHVIVMLTREVEGSSVKCGKYWEEGSYGPLRLKLLESNDTPERERQRRESEMAGGFFGLSIAASKPPKVKRPADDASLSTIKRVFELTNTAYPNAPPRTVTQFQYLEWPDLNVPQDPRSLLALMHSVEAVQMRLQSTASARSLPVPQPHSDANGNVDSVDPATGVVQHARDSPPLLLHCSAGVGRTGGYIAVDALLDGIRREMRKREYGKVAADATALAAQDAFEYSVRRDAPDSDSSGDKGKSGSEAMDVDTSASFGSSSSSPPLDRQDHSLTMPVSAGEREVHVPVAGFTDPAAMEVDVASASSEGPLNATASPFASRQPPLRAPILQASPALVAEVRRATLQRFPTCNTSNAATGRLPDSSSQFSHASGSVATSTACSGSAVPPTSVFVSPPTSHTGSSANVSAAMIAKTARMGFASPPPPHPLVVPPEMGDVRLRTVSLPSSMSGSALARPDSQFDPSHMRASAASQSQRLNTWRSDIRSAANTPEAKNREDPFENAVVDSEASRDSSAPQDSSSDERSSEPRALHRSVSPPMLSSLDEPIHRVIEDMRKQRMSLCQSLRQYVFVHRAIIEGALMIVDEENQRNGAVRVKDNGKARVPATPPQRRSSGEASAQETGTKLSPAFTFTSPIKKPGAPRRASMDPAVVGSRADAMAGLFDMPMSRMTSPGRTKRSASPTELLRKDRRGDVMLMKRPSLKRRQRTDEDMTFDSMRIPGHGMPLAS